MSRLPMNQETARNFVEDVRSHLQYGDISYMSEVFEDLEALEYALQSNHESLVYAMADYLGKNLGIANRQEVRKYVANAFFNFGLS